MKTIGVITPGGDAPGMNAAIRAVARIAHSRNFKVLGFERGWYGLLTNSKKHLTPRAVGGIVQLGGTMLHTLRCPPFETKEGIEMAEKTLRINNVEALVVIGGDGSFRGANELSEKSGVTMIGIPATIDNDVFGTDETIGFDTALNTAIGAIDKIRDTAISHERIFIVEVMGRKRGFLALHVGIAIGAEVILIPEKGCDIKSCEIDKIVHILNTNSKKGKQTGIIVVAEGVGNTSDLAEDIAKHTGSEVRLSILGYAQRGGSPTGRSRLLASLFAEKAVNLIFKTKENQIVGLKNGEISSIPMNISIKTQKSIDLTLLELAEKLSI
ncbi:MAG: 6-phosphofructokinase [Candidatus Bathyarchaeota archaeon]|jgi:6-phosphofructokinase 1|nr:6-phosphofructokinase [Candidatus Bathyarchaeota archaeon]